MPNSIIRVTFRLKVLAFTFFVFYGIAANAQHKKDSLWKCWSNKSLHDSSRLKALNDYIYEFHIQKKTDSALVLLKTHHDFSVKAGNKKQLAANHGMMGSYYLNKNKYMIAQDYFNKSLAINQEIKNDRSIAGNYNQLGLAHFHQDHFDTALNYYFNALKIFEAQKNINEQAAIYNNIGMVYGVLYDTLQQLKYYEKSYAITMQTTNARRQIIAAINLSMTENMIASRQDSVEKRVLRHLEKCREAGYKDLEIKLLEILADSYLHNKDYKKSLAFREKAGELAFSENDSIGICNYYYHKARLFYFNNEIEKAPPLLEKSIQVAKKIEHWRMVKRGAIFLSDIYASMGNYKAALDNYTIFSWAKDSMNSGQAEKALFKEQTKYEYEKKMLEEKVINDKAVYELKTKTAALEYQRIIWITVASGVALVLGISFLFYLKNTRQKRIIAEQKLNLTKQKLLVSQINPHFMFNSLNAIQNFIFREDALMAGDYLAQFSKLMRMILNFSREDYIKLSDEIDFLHTYLDLQNLRFGNKFDYEINCDPALDPDSTMIPPLLGQPFVENAIEHGMKYLNEKRGRIEVNMRLEENKLIYEVKDNGPGLLAGGGNLQANDKTHKSLATIITRERLESYSGNHNHTHEITITDNKQYSETETGVTVKFTTPCKLT
ncbi:MAG: histidine kinase [Bacteroidia bacterium]|jgi:tetratricopeptide (TPR) repeat protein|nr:histidine kinase [Bacteroidia bacterium]